VPRSTRGLPRTPHGRPRSPFRRKREPGCRRASRAVLVQVERRPPRLALPSRARRAQSRRQPTPRRTPVPLQSSRSPRCGAESTHGLGPTTPRWQGREPASDEPTTRCPLTQCTQDRRQHAPHSRHSPPPCEAAPGGVDRPALRPECERRRPATRSGRRNRLDRTAPESNRPSRGLHDRTGFEVLTSVGRKRRVRVHSWAGPSLPPQRLPRSSLVLGRASRHGARARHKPTGRREGPSSASLNA
jgi:hypothetical protein